MVNAKNPIKRSFDLGDNGGFRINFGLLYEIPAIEGQVSYSGCSMSSRLRTRKEPNQMELLRSGKIEAVRNKKGSCDRKK